MVALEPSLGAVDSDAAQGTSRALNWAGPNLVVALLLLMMVVTMLTAGAADSPTFDEPAHLSGAVGLAYDRDLGWNYEHPPLVKIVVGTALRVTGVEASQAGAGFEERNQWLYGREILYESGTDPSDAMKIVRTSMAGFAVLTGIALYGLTREFVGGWSSIVPVALYSLSPSVLGLGRILTFDLPVAGALMFILWSIIRTRKHPTFARAAICGLAVGLGLVTKLSMALYLVFLAPLIVQQFRAGIRAGGDRGWRSVVTLSGVTIAVAWLTVWLCYLLIDPTLTFSEPLPPAAAEGGVLHTLADVLPLPRPYTMGLRHNLATEAGQRPAFLLGDAYAGGRMAFYPVVISMKIPLGTLALMAMGIAAAIRSRRRELLTLVVGSAAFILSTAILSDLNIGFRYVLPATTLLLVPTALAAETIRRRWVVPALIATVAASSLSSFPHHLGYINEAWGGAGESWELVADSNIDWGQDLNRLADHLDESNGASHVNLAYFGTADPTAHGVDHTPITNDTDIAGLNRPIAISVSTYNFDRDRYASLGTPTGVVGSSILIWES